MTSKVAIITGAASGIGKHWAEVLSKKIGEYQLVFADSNEEGLRAAFTPAENILLCPLDIRSADGWRAVIDETLRRFGRIDYLFNIAGANRPLFFRDQPLEAIDRTIDINLKGALIGMKLVGEVMLKQGAGHIVNVASLAGVSPTPGNALYSAAKGGLRNASIATAIEWRKLGVAVTVISPDLVDTPVLTERLDSAGEEAALAFTGVTLTVFDLEKAFWKAMREEPLEINLPRWRGWLTKLNDLIPSIMFLLYDGMKKRGMKRLKKIRRERKA
ncbi:MAG: SDR family oxidoreductase [Anaerolineales bacterium]|jgi:3-oxoacyl-[acyl-carrier protein] reductase|nr:SDR family oxidoreductase [Chloroflexota bacterium]MBK6647930.1 SDR family oxidoreductase [Anaerolineales bacterium]